MYGIFVGGLIVVGWVVGHTLDMARWYGVGLGAMAASGLIKEKRWARGTLSRKWCGKRGQGQWTAPLPA